MEINLLLAGVGGQGILTIAQAISRVALREGLQVKESEVHGMSQRGGAVQSHLRIADHAIHSDLIPLGKVDLLLSVEPLEALRYAEYLCERAVVVSNSVPFPNIPNYPPVENLLDRIARLGTHVLLDAPQCARAAGSQRAENMVMLGAAVPFLTLPLGAFEQHIAEMFAAKGERVVEANVRALRLGYHASCAFRDAQQRGISSRAIRNWLNSLAPAELAKFATTGHAPVELQGPPACISERQIGQVKQILEAVRADDRVQLFEHEVYQILETAGAITPPRHRFLSAEEAITPDVVERFAGDRVVLKIVSPKVVHKSDAHGLTFVPKNVEAIQRERDSLITRFTEQEVPVAGVLLVEFVEGAAHGLGSELFVGIRQTREFGPVIAAGLGGVDTEYLANKMRPGIAVAKASAIDTSPEAFFALFQRTAAYDILAGRVRGHERVVGDGELIRCFRVFLDLARRFCLNGSHELKLQELEVNPFAFRRHAMVPLDGRGRLGKAYRAAAPRPLEQAARLLEPRSIAVVGVSAKRANFGRIILNNIQECGFPRSRLYVIKEGSDSIDGVRCYPSLDQLPEKVDLLVAATSAESVPQLVDQTLQAKQGHGVCSSVILIPGGLGEKAGTEAVQSQLKAAIDGAREAGVPAPVFLGGNCLGVRSRPAMYDTFFIPKNKIPPRRSAAPKRAALISQSGGFIITRLCNLEFLDPQFAISIGNQLDLTMSDMLHVLAAREDVDCIGVYAEGFSDLDGLAFLRAVEDATARGKVVVFYKAGRTVEGRSAAQGHTASVAGDYDVCQASVASAGAIVTDTFKEFEQLLELATDLHDKDVGGTRLAAVSNAGYECVGIADAIFGARYELSMSLLTADTLTTLKSLMQSHELDSLVNLANPLDLTPMASELVYEESIRTLIDDPQVDAVIVGCVPMSPRLLTTPDEIGHPNSLAHRLPRLFRESRKPLVFVVDCLEPYEAFAQTVRAAGVPVFRTADQAVRSLGRYLDYRAKRPRRKVTLENESGDLCAIGQSQLSEVTS